MADLVTGIHDFGTFNVGNTLRRIQISGGSDGNNYNSGLTPFGGDVVGDVFLTQSPTNNPTSEGRKIGSVDVDADAGGGILNSGYIQIDPSKLDPSKDAFLYLARGGKTDYLGSARVNAPDGMDPLGDRDESVIPDGDPSDEEPDPADQPGLVHADNEQGFALAPSMEDDYETAGDLIEDAQDGTLDVLDDSNSSDSASSDSSSSSDSATSSEPDSDSSGPAVESVLAVLGLIAVVLVYQTQS